MKLGSLYLIPTPLGDDSLPALSPRIGEVVDPLQYFIAERAKTARRFIRSLLPEKDLQSLHFSELNKRTTPEERNTFLEPALKGHDMGLLSEAGCPGVADPGALVVRQAHRLGIRVEPLVGPSSILLALMASGMDGQRFAFHGYLSPKKPRLAKDLKKLEQESARLRQTQLFMETPYRNMGMLDTALQSLQPGTLLGVAADLTLPDAYIRTLTVAEWHKTTLPELHKRPAMFCLLAGK